MPLQCLLDRRWSFYRRGLWPSLSILAAVGAMTGAPNPQDLWKRFRELSSQSDKLRRSPAGIIVQAHQAKLWILIDPRSDTFVHSRRVFQLPILLHLTRRAGTG